MLPLREAPLRGLAQSATEDRSGSNAPMSLNAETLDDPAAVMRDELNGGCFCIDVSPDAFWSLVGDQLDDPVQAQTLRVGRDHLVSTSPAFITRRDLERMEAVVRAVEAASRLEGYREAALAGACDLARQDFGTRGVMMGYDFHLGRTGPQLIEINTNAGGGFLNALLADAATACCSTVASQLPQPPAPDFEAAVMEMFRAEWRAQRGTGEPGFLVIVDDEPPTQYLYPEFVLVQALLRRHGLETQIADPSCLTFDGARLSLEGRTVDMIYNRLVDFRLERPDLAPIAAAAAAGAVVLSPAPRHHALFADKRNLVRLCDREGLLAMGLAPEHADALKGILQTRQVSADNADELWSQRKGLFFKPSGGHAGKRVYRGDKLTRGVWSEILAADDYIAQAYCPPTVREVMVDQSQEPRKMDVRLYTYGSRTLLVAARLYAGQTTNFRTPGGGFSPVIVIG